MVRELEAFKTLIKNKWIMKTNSAGEWVILDFNGKFLHKHKSDPVEAIFETKHKVS